MVEDKLFNGVFFGKKVLVTGHTGFKGSWLSYWLYKMGAEVYGVSLEPPTIPNHHSLISFHHESYIQNINDFEKLTSIFSKINPDFIFHLAAQPLVRYSYENPIETYTTNVLGTLNVLNASRYLSNLKGVLIVTSDKCYENKEILWGYREYDEFGGKDPYSSSKGCAEILTSSIRSSYFNISDYESKHNVLIASARAGNVIGGGDWADDRIVTDMVKNASRKQNLMLRSPNATRPWQHVLEPLSGYLLIASRIFNRDMQMAEGWNFGPDLNSNCTVKQLVEKSKKYWDRINFELDTRNHPHEAHILMLDITKARKLLNWEPVWNFEQTVGFTINWYRDYYENNKVLTEEHLTQYVHNAKEKGIVWAI
jgi:CDP-glucose 4,6-dehydratase